jgi:hypothetical protein
MSKTDVTRSLNHLAPDKIPVDFGSTPVTGIHVSAIARLRDYYGLEKRLVKAYEPFQMLGQVDDDLLDALGSDFVGLAPRNTLFGFPNENWQEFRTPWGQDVLVSEYFRFSREENGDYLLYPQGDTDAPASGRMPASSFFFDQIVRQPPIDDETLAADDNLEEFGELCPEDLHHFSTGLEELHSSERAIVANFGIMPFIDLGIIQGPMLKHPKGIRDMAEWLMSTITRQDYIHEVFTRQSDIAIRNLQKVHDIVSERIDVVYLCGNDFGTQTSTFCAISTFDELYAPYYKKVNDWIHKHTDWKIFKHSCGAIEPLMSRLIDVGFDIINPVQCSATGMDPQHLKNEYGDQIIFWGGGVDTQKTLPFGTAQQVRDEVLTRCEIFSKNGGFVFNSIHNLQANTPIENMVAMIDAVKEFNGDT